MGFRPNQERLSKIMELRAQGLTIDQIAAATGDPRSSVGYYVTKYCGGRARTHKSIPARPSAQPEAIKLMPMDFPRSEKDRLEAYLEEIEKKESLSLEDVLDGKKKEGDRILWEIVLDALQNDPEALQAKLNVIKELIRLAPLLRLDLDRMQIWLGQILVRKALAK